MLNEKLTLAENSVELYMPIMCEITQIKQFTEKEKWFEITMPEGMDLQHQPGQFVEISIFGIGEAPISITSSSQGNGKFELCIRNVGMLTDVIHRMNVGDKIGIRGPFGSGFELQQLKGKDILIVGGGIGIVPLRSLINSVIDNRSDFGRFSMEQKTQVNFYILMI